MTTHDFRHCTARVTAHKAQCAILQHALTVYHCTQPSRQVELKARAQARDLHHPGEVRWPEQACAATSGGQADCWACWTLWPALLPRRRHHAAQGKRPHISTDMHWSCSASLWRCCRRSCVLDSRCTSTDYCIGCACLLCKREPELSHSAVQEDMGDLRAAMRAGDLDLGKAALFPTFEQVRHLGDDPASGQHLHCPPFEPDTAWNCPLRLDAVGKRMQKLTEKCALQMALFVSQHPQLTFSAAMTEFADRRVSQASRAECCSGR